MARKEDNLKPFDSNQSREQAKINGRKGGIKSGENRRARKTMREVLDYLLSKEITNSKGEKAQTIEAVMVATLQKAMSGDIKAVRFIRDTIGEMPIQKQEITGANGEPIGIQKVYITPEEQEAVKKHIQEFINEDNS